MTQLEPAFEGLLQGQAATQLQAPPTHQQQAPPIDTIPVSDYPLAAGLTGLTAGSRTRTDLSGGSEESVDIGPPSKKQKVASSELEEDRRFPSDKDIDDFLDQLHGN